jgi:hypothetical protein
MFERETRQNFAGIAPGMTSVVRQTFARPTLFGREFPALYMTGGNALFRANAFVSWGSLFDPLIPI